MEKAGPSLPRRRGRGRPRKANTGPLDDVLIEWFVGWLETGWPPPTKRSFDDAVRAVATHERAEKESPSGWGTNKRKDLREGIRDALEKIDTGANQEELMLRALDVARERGVKMRHPLRATTLAKIKRYRQADRERRLGLIRRAFVGILPSDFPKSALEKLFDDYLALAESAAEKWRKK